MANLVYILVYYIKYNTFTFITEKQCFAKPLKSLIFSHLTRTSMHFILILVKNHQNKINTMKKGVGNIIALRL